VKDRFDLIHLNVRLCADLCNPIANPFGWICRGRRSFRLCRDVTFVVQEQQVRECTSNI
jgi:hypothetical protein